VKSFRNFSHRSPDCRSRCSSIEAAIAITVIGGDTGITSTSATRTKTAMSRGIGCVALTKSLVGPEVGIEECSLKEYRKNYLI
jgi:hypothetical protein